VRADSDETVVTLRVMAEADLTLVGAWLAQPHVARWWTTDTTAGAELDRYRARVRGDEPRTRMLVVVEGAAAVGWCQWYRWEDYPREATAMAARPGEVGIDYAIGEPTGLGRGVGTATIAALVAEARRHVPRCGVLVDPDASNLASRAVLERNGFALVAVRAVATEPSTAPRAIYRLAAGVPTTPGAEVPRRHA
jgi:aminoglycoside 6'-N-acetyltransferase